MQLGSAWEFPALKIKGHIYLFWHGIWQSFPSQNNMAGKVEDNNGYTIGYLIPPIFAMQDSCEVLTWW